MKSILEGREALKAVVYQIAEVTGYLWQKGWAERNGGNITVNVTEYMDEACKALPAISEVKQIGMTLPQLKGSISIAKERASACVIWRGSRCRTAASSVSATTVPLTR